MKKILLVTVMFMLTTLLNAQFSSTQNFNASTTTPAGWTSSSGSVSATSSCEGNSFRVNMWSSNTTATLTSPLYSPTNALPISVSFDYKVINYTGASTPPGTATPKGWGTSKLQYSADNGTTWTNLITIDGLADTYVPSNACATQTGIIPAGTVPTGSSIKLKFTHTWTTGDYYIYLDNIKIIQEFGTGVVDWGNLQWPSTGTIALGEDYIVYGQVYKSGVTEPAGQGAGISAWVGYSTTNTDPATWTNWVPATFNTAASSGNNDEYMANLKTAITVPGTFYYATRYSYEGGAFYYGGYNSNGGGAWNGTDNVNGILTINGPAGWTCTNPITVTTLPYDTSGNTANFGDLIDGTPGSSGCGSTFNYLNGNDVIYAFTPSQNMNIDITMTPSATYSGIFVYNSCSNIGVSCLAGVANSGNAARKITAFQVVAGTTYYFVISTWPDPQTTGYQLQISQNVLGVSDEVKLNDVSVYPNPTKDVINVKGMVPTSVQVISMEGKNIPVTFEGTVINTQKLPAGSYLIQLTDKNGNTVSKRIIKK